MIATMELVGDKKVGLLPIREIDPVKIARDVAAARDEQGSDDAFMVINLDKILDRFSLWKRELPMIEPFYAVKCNTDPVLVRTLAALGAGFDCASKEEIDIVLDMGVAPERVIYANPCKTRSFITHAKEREVKMMTFDNAEELEKIAKLHPNAEMILRIAVSDPTATCPLNLKFGSDPVRAAPQLLLKSKQMGINVIGISFHVGSGCNDPTAYRDAIGHARTLFDIGLGLGFDMKILDMGGGFPGSAHHTSFEQIASVIRDALDQYFPSGDDVRLIAEPGRFFAAAPFTLAANIIHATEVPAKKVTKKDEDADDIGYMYYLNDGVYGSFNCILFDHVHPTGRPLFDEDGERFPSTIWGPTCDSLDMIEDVKLMRHLSVGDWMLYENMGAYTSAASTTFNGFQRPTALYVMTQNTWNVIGNSPHV